MFTRQSYVTTRLSLCLKGILLVSMIALCNVSSAANWPTWRGPRGDSVSPESNFPIQWNQETNVRWKVALPARGNSSPIIWNDLVMVTQSTDDGQRRSLMAWNRSDGTVAWEHSILYKQPETKHQDNTYCASSPVTDGERIFVSYASAGLYCYDMHGKVLWHRDLGPQKHAWGDGSSPILHEETLIFFHGPGPESKLYALDKKTGKDLWVMEQPAYQADASREDGFKGNQQGMIGSFATPLLTHGNENRTEIIMTFPEWIGGIDVETGQTQWSCEGLNPLVYSSPMLAKDAVVVMGGYFGPVISIRLGGQGDVTKTHRLWKTGRTPHRLGTGVIKDGHIYVFDRPGLLHCMNLQSGKTVFEERVRGQGANPAIWGSAILAGDKLYTVNQSGETIIARASPSFELIAMNPLEEPCNATPAFSDGEIFIRTHAHLWCIGSEETL
jgi:outer membrane protein assembly factor BamB